MLSFSEFSAWVSIDGVEAEEYGVTVDGARVTCWIASEANKTFRLHWKDSVVSSPTRGNPSIDGTTYPPRYIDSPRRNEVFLGGVRDSDSSKRPFMFTKLNLTDDDAYLDVAAPPSLGEIEVTLYRVERRRNRNHRPPLNNISQGVDLTRRVYHEHNKKGIDHEASLGSPRRVESISRSQRKPFSFTKPKGNPIVTFCFKYRPLDVLQAEDIAPRPQPVQPAQDTSKPEVKDVIVVDDAEIEFLYMRANKVVKHDDGIIDLTGPDDVYASRDVIKLDEEDVVLPKTPQQNDNDRASGSQEDASPEIKDEYNKPFGLSNVYFDLTV
ncbi:uncharacterized protein EV420DRAFT_1494636 [Desarmillaria tabescens]|uniref:DUF7918 domain-containing protein n=1 Tax=Armillaria tabescens TaxID=1929756 RepID=A0AA39NPJ1_ARMTA|nr:uncharacterized protein EV420DRAFT_1494636 [Desarmillaria tabescens]KAK0469472.1 hypothetical protein EV420DRAFT_1494636 [Desarmillaria tabescens]